MARRTGLGVTTMVTAATVDASTALVIIDVQRGMFMFERPLWHADDILGRISGLLRCARQANACVVHVQHDGGPGHLLAKGSIGWPHRPEVAPVEGEITIEKHHSSAFHNTDLHDRLSRIGIRRLMVAGIQTEYCVDSACRAAVALGYQVTLLSDAHSTFDSSVLTAEQIVAHHNSTLSDGFVALSRTDEVMFGSE
jgi:nicotinamidase-related amidase